MQNQSNFSKSFAPRSAPRFPRGFNSSFQGPPANWHNLPAPFANWQNLSASAMIPAPGFFSAPGMFPMNSVMLPPHYWNGQPFYVYPPPIDSMTQTNPAFMPPASPVSAAPPFSESDRLEDTGLENLHLEEVAPKPKRILSIATASDEKIVQTAKPVIFFLIFHIFF